ncbi:hypothetical protein [Myroides phaeus]|uniref:Uncharacterized protein n=1 Tax=Myroides phaeus TaxID=702745 RepID=A0A1G8EE80_9FLAO|nr:hypothetical protein [Myroides phaeus]MEC4115939.1 hypothetical protein [Myroides phaeus]SDH68213.1 hypothetical protein SAMN05421818_11073 [Myroides phaeus]
MTQLTNRQIDYIRKVVQSNGAYYYEVTEELTDHLISSIEELWNEEPLLSFEQVFQIQFNNFGKDNFLKIKKENEKMHFSIYKSMFLKEIQSFFRLPQITITIAFLLTAFAFLTKINNLFFTLLFLVLALGSPYFLNITLQTNNNKNPVINERLNIKQRFLIDETFRRVVSSINATSGFIYLIISIIPRYQQFTYLIDTLAYNIVFAFCFTLLALTNYICWFVLYPRYKKEKENILKIT